MINALMWHRKNLSEHQNVHSRLAAADDPADLKVGHHGHLSFMDEGSNDRCTPVTGRSTHARLIALRERLPAPEVSGCA